MMKTKNLYKAVVLSVALGLMTGCDSELDGAQSVPADPALSAISANLSEAGVLDVATAKAVDRAFAEMGEGSEKPGGIWFAAAKLQETLSDEQKLDLMELSTRQREERTERTSATRKTDGKRGTRKRSHSGWARMGYGDILTDEQKSEAKELMSASGSELRQIMRSVRAGEVEIDAVRDQMLEIRKKQKEQLEALLTPEQKAEIESRKEAKKTQALELKEDYRQSMTEALGLSADQLAQLDELTAKRKEDAKTAKEQKTRRSRDDAEASRTAKMDELAEILTPEQLETTKIYHALRSAGEKKSRKKRSRSKRGKAKN